MSSIDLNITCGEITVNVPYGSYRALNIDLVDVSLDFVNDKIIESIKFEDYINVHGIEHITDHLKKYYTFDKDELTIND